MASGEREDGISATLQRYRRSQDGTDGIRNLASHWVARNKILVTWGAIGNLGNSASERSVGKILVFEPGKNKRQDTGAKGVDNPRIRNTRMFQSLDHSLACP